MTKAFVVFLSLALVPSIAFSFTITNSGFETGDRSGWFEGTCGYPGGWEMDSTTHNPGGSIRANDDCTAGPNGAHWASSQTGGNSGIGCMWIGQVVTGVPVGANTPEVYVSWGNLGSSQTICFQWADGDVTASIPGPDCPGCAACTTGNTLISTTAQFGGWTQATGTMNNTTGTVTVWAGMHWNDGGWTDGTALHVDGLCINGTTPVEDWVLY